MSSWSSKPSDKTRLTSPGLSLKISVYLDQLCQQQGSNWKSLLAHSVNGIWRRFCILLVQSHDRTIHWIDLRMDRGVFASTKSRSSALSMSGCGMHWATSCFICGLDTWFGFSSDLALPAAEGTILCNHVVEQQEECAVFNFLFGLCCLPFFYFCPYSAKNSRINSFLFFFFILRKGRNWSDNFYWQYEDL